MNTIFQIACVVVVASGAALDLVQHGDTSMWSRRKHCVVAFSQHKSAGSTIIRTLWSAPPASFVGSASVDLYGKGVCKETPGTEVARVAHGSCGATFAQCDDFNFDFE